MKSISSAYPPKDKMKALTAGAYTEPVISTSPTFLPSISITIVMMVISSWI